MDPIIDLLAEAICNAHCGDTEAWDITYDKGRDHWRHVAQAALDVIETQQPPVCQGDSAIAGAIHQARQWTGRD